MLPDINFRKEVSDLLKNTQYTILLQNTSKKIRCSCYNEKYREANSKCTKCLGTGYLFKFERHKSFKQDYSTSPDSILFTEIGKVKSSYRIFYFAHDVYPKTGDYIWEVTWNKSKPVGLNMLFKINEVSEQRGDTGRIEYFIALAEVEAIDKNFKNHYIGKAWGDLK